MGNFHVPAEATPNLYLGEIFLAVYGRIKHAAYTAKKGDFKGEKNFPPYRRKVSPMRKEKEQRSVRGKPSGLSPKRKF